MRTKQRKQRIVLAFLAFLFIWFFVSVLVGCGSASGGCALPQQVHSKPYLSLTAGIDNTLSFPTKFQQAGARKLADALWSYITPGISGMFADVLLIEANSEQNSFVTFSVDAIPPIPPMPQACNDPFQHAKDLSDWKNTVKKINEQVSSERARIKPYLDKLYSINLHEVGGTDIPGIADTASSEFSHHRNGKKILLYISDMQSNIDMNFSKHINLYGAKVRTYYRVCQVQSECEQNDAFWMKQFTAWGASSYEAFSPAESDAEDNFITF